ncbi:MAG: hypothetical protein JO041_15290 [Acidobacteria bacterium]|nr:hypothetical protein [Acidobacteriota bacterium]
MRSGVVLKTTTFLMLAVFPLSTIAGTAGVAVVYPDHAMNLNGAVLERSQAVVDGDNLRTQKGGATIALNGATLQMGDDSEVVFHPAGARVMNGSLAVTTAHATSTEVVNLHVEPASEQARYLVTEQGSRLVIAAMEGSVKVSDGKETVVVDHDKALVARLEPLGIGDDNGTPHKDGKAISASGNAIPAAGIGVTLSKAQLMMIAAAAAAAGAVATYLITNRAPASGSH